MARRIRRRGAHGDDVQEWLYFAGELGGGTWAVRRADNSEDVFTYRDFRAIFGFERNAVGRLDYRFEAGYVFGREIEWRHANHELHLDDSVFLRLATTY